jgi:predicted transcriptional regulator
MRIGSHDDNMKDMTDRQRHGMPATVVRAIRKLLAEGRTQQEIATLYGIAPSTVSALAVQRSHQHVRTDNEQTENSQ